MNSQTQPRTYYVVRKHVHNGKVQTLDQSDFTSEKEAKNWFTEAEAIHGGKPLRGVFLPRVQFDNE